MPSKKIYYDNALQTIEGIKRKTSGSSISVIDKVVIDFDTCLLHRNGQRLRFGADGLLNTLSMSYKVMVFSTRISMKKLAKLVSYNYRINIIGKEVVGHHISYINNLPSTSVLITDKNTTHSYNNPSQYIHIPT